MPTTVRVMTFNVALNQGDTQPVLIAGVINDENPDIVAIQESKRPALFSVFDELWRLGWPNTGRSPVSIGALNYDTNDTLPTQFGNCIFARMQMSQPESIALPSAGGMEPRRMMRDTITVPGVGALWVYCVHTDQYAQRNAQDPSQDQHMSALNWASSSIAPQSRRIVCGDFNATPNDPRMSETWFGAGTKFYTTDLYNTIPGSGPTEKRDYLFYNAPVPPTPAPVTPGIVSVRQNKASDHAALWCDFAIR